MSQIIGVIKKKEEPIIEKSVETVLEPKYYQAVGLLSGKVFLKDEKLFIKHEGIDYEVIKSHKILTHKKLVKRITKNGDEELSLIVYPVVYRDLKTRKDKIMFRLLRFNEFEEKQNVFRIRGVYEFSKLYKSRVVKIYRNPSEIQKVKKLCKRSESYDPCKPVLIPVEGIKNRKLNDKRFVQWECQLSKGKLVFVKNIDRPTKEKPQYVGRKMLEELN